MGMPYLSVLVLAIIFLMAIMDASKAEVKPQFSPELTLTTEDPLSLNESFDEPFDYEEQRKIAVEMINKDLMFQSEMGIPVDTAKIQSMLEHIVNATDILGS
ncbi:PREDICTED: uncharacterized protein LOC108768787 [Trachymyrmex cornetzi]|uniref:uncharacterized protein LOC108768787 n=1 Tax=Trachymyrmex cornetzi TaxID=471704 RepID=UPI00084F1FFA|nr:PREDICTED: uncharacterized protein LOC108768787 [Trachymyrmex cornetzi]